MERTGTAEAAALEASQAAVAAAAIREEELRNELRGDGRRSAAQLEDTQPPSSPTYNVVSSSSHATSSSYLVVQQHLPVQADENDDISQDGLEEIQRVQLLHAQALAGQDDHKNLVNGPDKAHGFPGVISFPPSNNPDSYKGNSLSAQGSASIEALSPRAAQAGANAAVCSALSAPTS